MKSTAPLRSGTGCLIVLVRRELRVQDHLALWSAVRDAGSVLPLFVVDRAFLACAPAKRLLALESLRRMREALRKLGGDLFVRRGEAREAVLRLAGEAGAAGVYLTSSADPVVQREDALLRASVESAGKLFRAFDDDTVFAAAAILNSSGEPYKVYSAYRRAWLAKREEIAPPLPAVRALRSPSIEPGEIPPPGELGLKEQPRLPGAGEAAAAAALERFLDAGAPGYRASRDLLAVDGTSRLSHHYALGTLGARSAYRAIAGRLAAAGNGPGSEGIGTFLNQFIWREFYKQILANFPHVAGGSFRREFDAVPWKPDAARFDAWRRGLTGYPVVDAAMRQLASEGWMHNRGRMIVASFLTKDLHVDWREGERHFMDLLADGDPALNNGGWQWSAGTGTDAQPWYRIFNPVLQGRKFDPDGAYVRKYVPELARVPDRHIHAPWEMPPAAAAAAGAVVGRDYPGRIVDHDAQRARTLALFRSATRPGDFSYIPTATAPKAAPPHDRPHARTKTGRPRGNR